MNVRDTASSPLEERGRATESNAPRRQAFFIGGAYSGEHGQQVMRGAMYVEHIRPARVTQKYPLVFLHGAAQTSANWLETPDGRKGWAQHFAECGYELYLVDQPARGRSAWHLDLDGPLRSFAAPAVERLFTASSTLGTWPQAGLHDQWPGDGPDKGRMGDPVFDQFFASQVGFLESREDAARLVTAAMVGLLDRIGPAVLVTHSQAGPFGWLTADARPALVKGIVALEPNGPPIEACAELGGRRQLAWGVADIPITYAPAIRDAAELRIVRQSEPDRPDLLAGWLQEEPARQLVNLKDIPVLILTAEASYHAQFDHCTAKWLQQAGVANDFVRMEEVGIKGNGHMMMMEKNNLVIADWINAWLQTNLS